jgi:hypothetical protein
MRITTKNLIKSLPFKNRSFNKKLKKKDEKRKSQNKSVKLKKLVNLTQKCRLRFLKFACTQRKNLSALIKNVSMRIAKKNLVK